MKGTRTGDHLTSGNPKVQGSNKREGAGFSQFSPHPTPTCPAATHYCPTIPAHLAQPASPPLGPSVPPMTPMTASTFLFHAHSLVVAVPVQFNVIQIGGMCNDISILLYQLRISGQLFLKENRGRINRAGKRTQKQLLDAKRQAFFPPQISLK